MSDDLDTSALVGHWVHSHEEDSHGSFVYRRAGYPFPRSRGRAGFDLRADGTLIGHGLGPSDRSAGSVGTWSITPDGSTLVLTYTSPSKRERRLRIVSIAPDRLVVADA